MPGQSATRPEAGAGGRRHGALSRPDVAEGALSGAGIAQGVEIALSGHDRADAAGDAAVLTPGIGPAGRACRDDVPMQFVANGVKGAGFRRSLASGLGPGGASGERRAVYGRKGPICRTTGPFL